MNITKNIIALACFSVITMRAMEEKIEPCSQEEYRRYLHEFEEKGCYYKCRNEQLKKLAENFESKKDDLYLRALLCANRSPKNWTYLDQVEVIENVAKDEEGSIIRTYHFDTRVPFLNKAIAHRNIDFLKTFFGLYSIEGTTPITFTGQSQYPFNSLCSRVAEPDFGFFNQLEAIKDEGVAELMFANIKRPISLAVLLRCKAFPFFAPGCKFALKKYQQDTEAALQNAAVLEQKKQAWEQSLREVGK